MWQIVCLLRLTWKALGFRLVTEAWLWITAHIKSDAAVVVVEVVVEAAANVVKVVESSVWLDLEKNHKRSTF